MARRQYQLGRRIAAALSLFAYLVAALGVPLPVVAARPGGVPFPCQNHACGCHSAEECWRHCCCYTVEEHWAWARAHGIEPPAYAARPVAEAPAKCCKHCCAASTEPAKHAPASDRGRSVVIGFCCHGPDALGTAGIVALVPPAPLSGRPALPAASRLCTASVTARSDAEPPTPPPPRFVRA